MTEQFRGVLVPVLTPFKPDLSPDTDRFIGFCRWLVSEGANGLAVFGTTSEANSLTVDEKLAMFDALRGAGISGDLLMPGTGACALPDAIRMTRHTVTGGARGVLVLPPFYYKNPTDDGLIRYFSEIIEATGSDALRLYFYHFPQMATVPIPSTVIAELRKRYGPVIAGLKDSSGDIGHTDHLIAEFPDMAIFPGSERFLLHGLEQGAAGCISATANVQVRTIAKLIERWQTDEARTINDHMVEVRTIMEGGPAIPRLKAVIARAAGDADWLQVRPPLVPMDRAAQEEMFAALNAASFEVSMLEPA